MIEFAVSFMIVFSLFAGTYQWGYNFYVYDTLVTQVREAARYASTKPYDKANQRSTDDFKGAVRNMVLYGTSKPSEGAAPCARGLTASNVDVSIEGETQQSVTVAIKDYTVDSVFGKLTLKGRPKASFPYTAGPIL